MAWNGTVASREERRAGGDNRQAAHLRGGGRCGVRVRSVASRHGHVRCLGSDLPTTWALLTGLGRWS